MLSTYTHGLLLPQAEEKKRKKSSLKKPSESAPPLSIPPLSHHKHNSSRIQQQHRHTPTQLPHQRKPYVSFRSTLFRFSVPDRKHVAFSTLSKGKSSVFVVEAGEAIPSSALSPRLTLVQTCTLPPGRGPGPKVTGRLSPQRKRRQRQGVSLRHPATTPSNNNTSNSSITTAGGKAAPITTHFPPPAS